MKSHKMSLEWIRRLLELRCCTPTGPAVGWIQGVDVNRNIDRRMKIGSDIVIFFVFYKHDVDTSKHSEVVVRRRFRR